MIERPRRAAASMRGPGCRILFYTALLMFCLACSALAQGTAPPDTKAQVGGTPPTTAPANPAAPTAQTPTDSDAIRKLIEVKMKEAAARTATRPADRQPAGPRPPAPRPGALAPAATTQPGATTKPGHGCEGQGGQLDLTPPPPDKPQPRWACAQPEITADAVWAGETAQTVFKVTNEGQSVLNLTIKKL